MNEFQSLRPLVLSKLARWRALTLGDLFEMLPPDLRDAFSATLIEQMEEQGLVRARPAGDELVVVLTDEGRRQAEQVS